MDETMTKKQNTESIAVTPLVLTVPGRRTSAVMQLIVARWRQLEDETGAFLTHQLVGNLQQNTGAVSSQRVRPDGAPMGKVDQDVESLVNDVVRFAVLDIDNEADAAGVVFLSRIV